MLEGSIDLTSKVTGVLPVANGGTGSTTGNAPTATALAAPINIGGVAFDGTENIDLPGVNIAGNQDTSGNAATVTDGVYTTSSVTVLSDVTSAGSGAIITDAERNKLIGIETGADVTDTANVTAAGALMDSEVTDLAD